MQDRDMQILVGIRQSDLLPILRTRFDTVVLDRIRGQNKHIFADNNHDDIFQRWKKSGIDGTELIVSANLSDSDIKKTHELLQQHAFPVISIHQPQALKQVVAISLSEIERLCEIANIFSAKRITLHLDAVGRKIFDDKFVSELKSMEKKFEVTFGIENCPKYILSLTKKFAWKENKFPLILAEQKLHMTLDTTHLAQVGGDIITCYKENKDRITNIHLSDYVSNFYNKKLLLATGQHLPLGTGQLPIKNFLKLLKETKYDGLVTMEIDTDMVGFCDNARYIREGIGK